MSLLAKDKKNTRIVAEAIHRSLSRAISSSDESASSASKLAAMNNDHDKGDKMRKIGTIKTIKEEDEDSDTDIDVDSEMTEVEENQLVSGKLRGYNGGIEKQPSYLDSAMDDLSEEEEKKGEANKVNDAT